jgi:hypothetical protein
VSKFLEIEKPDYEPERRSGRGIDGNLPLDYDAGLTRFCHASGLNVSVYDNKPGQYYLDSGQPATEEQAEHCGIDIHSQRKLKREAESKTRAAEMVQHLAELKKNAEATQARPESEGTAELREKANAAARKFLEAEAKRIAADDSKRLAHIEEELRHTGRGR